MSAMCRVLVWGTVFLFGVMPMDSPVTREEFLAETDKIFSKLNRHDREISVLQTVVENFKDLPSAINNLEKTMALMGQNLETLNKKVDKIIDGNDSKAESERSKDAEQDRLIRELDDKSKVDIVVFLKNNWWKITMSAAVVLVLIERYIPQ